MKASSLARSNFCEAKNFDGFVEMRRGRKRRVSLLLALALVLDGRALVLSFDEWLFSAAEMAADDRRLTVGNFNNPCAASP